MNPAQRSRLAFGTACGSSVVIGFGVSGGLSGPAADGKTLSQKY